MVLTVVRPAPYLETVALMRDHAGLKPGMVDVAIYQVSWAATFGFVDENGVLLAVMGFWPLAVDADEIFLVGRPAAEVGPRMVELARRARLILDRRMQSGIGRIIGHVRIGHEPGNRLARLAGFSLSADGAPPGFQRWMRSWDNSSRDCSATAAPPNAPSAKPSSSRN